MRSKQQPSVAQLLGSSTFLSTLSPDERAGLLCSPRQRQQHHHQHQHHHHQPKQLQAADDAGGGGSASPRGSTNGRREWLEENMSLLEQRTQLQAQVRVCVCCWQFQDVLS
jgi:hypothetical protein